MIARRPHPKSPARRPQRGSALISTLLVLLVLTIIVVAFLQSMAIERETARSYKNRFQAELLARSGATEAVSLLLQSDPECLVNAYMEDSVTHNGTTEVAPYLTTLKLSSNGGSIQETRYLCSSIDPAATGAPFWRKPSLATTTGTTDINAPTSAFPEGFIGLANSSGSPRVIPVPWREILADPSKPRDDNRSSSNYNPVVGRFAYWVDDESAKINVTTAGSVDSANAHKRQAGGNLSEVAMHPVLQTDPTVIGPNPDVSSFLTQRDALPTIRDAAQPFPPATFRYLSAALDGDSLWSQRRAFLTTTGEADERGPTGNATISGIRRINLNDWVNAASDYQSFAGRQRIAASVVGLGDFLRAVLPEFGKRAANSITNPSASTTDPERRYCVQIAANIHDFIDADSQPTVIRQNLDTPQWEEPPDPTGIGEGAPTQPPAAFGKEAVPSVTEYLAYYYNDGGALRIDHTFEVLNIYTKDITLNPARWGTVRLFMAERNAITPNTGSNAVSPDLADPLVLTLPPNTVFPAGRYSLLTTLPSGSTYRSQWIASGPLWTPLNWINLARTEGTFALGNNGLRMEGDVLATAADATTEIVLANEFGYLDIQPRIAQQGPITFTAASSRLIGTQPFGNDGSSSGNNVHRKYPLDSGDPRSMTDVFPAYSEASGSPSSIAWRRNTANSQTATLLGQDSNGGTFGFIPDNSGSDPTAYVPEPLFGTGNARTVSVIRDGKMSSIGELGMVYDPALPAGSLTNGTWNRGGFRTLAIGSRYGETEAFSTNNPNLSLPQATNQADMGRRAYRLMDVFDASNSRKGRILLNSVLRDPRNIPLRAVFFNLLTQSNNAAATLPNGEFAGPADPKLTPSKQVKIDGILQALRTAASGSTPTDPDKAGPFVSLGQIGELTVFNKGTGLLDQSLTPDTTRNTALYNRGQEEILRNSFQLLTLKGTVYTVYVVAQSGRYLSSKSPPEFIPTSTIRMVQTVKLEREYPAASLAGTTAPELISNNTPQAGKTQARVLNTIFY